MTTSVEHSTPHTNLDTDSLEFNAMQQRVVHAALSQRMTQEPGSETSTETIFSFSRIESYFSGLVQNIFNIAVQTIKQLESWHACIDRFGAAPENLLKLNANTQFLQAVMDVKQTIPLSFTASFPGGLSRELIATNSKKQIQWIHDVSDCALQFYTRIFNKHADPMLSKLGWDLDQNREEIALVKQWIHKMIVPISLSDVRNTSIHYPWKNYVIDNHITPGDCKIIERICRLPSSAKPDWRLKCPISLDVMRFPMQTPCGHIFDSHNIISEVCNRGKCPLDRQPVSLSELVPEEALRREIHQWLKSQFVTITAHASLKKDDFLAIRGENKAGLSWDKGIPLKMVRRGIWVTEIPYVEGCHYKVLINDSNELWESGDNHKITVRGNQNIVPSFPYKL